MRFHAFVLVALAFATVSAASRSGSASEPVQARVVRLALVNVPDDVLRPLLPMFRTDSGQSAEIVYTGPDPFSEARGGRADLVVAHFGHEEVEAFVTGGFGLWPRTVFANQMVLLGPSSDPAGVRGLTDPAEAMRRIARSKSRFIVNNGQSTKYVEDVAATMGAVERPWQGYTDTKVEGPAAAAVAADQRGYVFWGLPPYLRNKRFGGLPGLEPLVVASPLFQRVMVSMVTNPAKVTGVNVEGAKAFEQFLLSPKIQAWIEAFRYPDYPHQAWWAAGRHNHARD